MSAPTASLNRKQQELVRLHQLSPTFDLEAALKEFASKPRGRPVKPKTELKPVEVSDTEDAVRREGRFLLEHLENRDIPFVRKTCRGCDRDFLCSYKFSAYCSDSCRAAGYFEKYGFIWNPENSEANRWEFWKVPPSTIKPQTLQRLEAFARAILGIDPTPADLALPTPRIEPPIIPIVPRKLGKPKTPKDLQRERLGLHENNVPSEQKAEKHESFASSSAAIPTDKLSLMAVAKKRFTAGELTAHELQVELASILRG